MSDEKINGGGVTAHDEKIHESPERNASLADQARKQSVAMNIVDNPLQVWRPCAKFSFTFALCFAANPSVSIASFR